MSKILKNLVALQLDRQPLCLIEYDDALARRFVERITVADAETIQVKIRNVDVVIERKLC